MNENETIAIPWSELVAGAWAPGFVERPCESGVLAVGRRWPGWRTGAPPTWAAFVADREISGEDRRWLVARVLVRDRRRLVAWAVDCAEAVVHLAPDQEAIRRDVLAPLRCWIGGAATDLAAARAAAIFAAASTDAAAAAAAAAAYAADACTAAASAASAANDYAYTYACADACFAAADTNFAAARAAASFAAASFAAASLAAAYRDAFAAADDRMLALALPHLEAVMGAAR